jgi:hypothetical protein
MATRSTIAVQHTDGTISQIYCHWDGYLEHNGKILLTHYSTLEQVENLVQHGDMSVLDVTTKWSTYYHRDREEEWEQVKPKLFNNLSEYRNQLNQEEFNYIFKNGRWYYKEWRKKLFIKVPEKYKQA